MKNGITRGIAAMASLCVVLVSCAQPAVGTAARDTTPPSEVSALAATAGNGQVTLAWAEPADADFAKVTITCTGFAASEAPKGVSSKTISGLSNGTEYTFLVKTIDANGNVSAGKSVNATPKAPTLPTHSVRYYAYGMTGGAAPTDPSAYEEGSTVTVLANSGNLERTGYIFGGWNTETSGNGTTYAAGSGTFVMGTGDVYLYAVWTVPAVTYSINYHANGGVLIPTVDPTSYAPGNSAVIMNCSWTAAGYAFEGWNTKDDGKGTTYAPGSKITIANANVDLWAIWQPGSGALDMRFHSPSNMIPQIIAVQSDGKILVGGMYVSADGTSGANGSHLARLSSDGSLDASFNPGTGLDDEAHQKYGPECMLVQADDSIMIGGYFTTVNGVRRNRVARLNPDGSLDETFDPGDGAGNGIVEAICPVSDGYLVAGYFSRFGNLNRGRIVKVSKNGATDAAWPASGSGANDGILSITALPGGQFMIVGDFTSYDGVARNHIARINSDGTLDAAFNPASSFDLTNTSTHSVDIRSVSVDSSGRVYIGGGFPNYAIRCNADGSLDSTFPTGAGFNGNVTAIAPQDDGKILVAGYFSTVNGTDHPVFARLNSDGSVDSGFNKVTNLNGTALTFPSSIMFAVQNNGMIVSCANTGVIRIYP